MPNWKQSSSLTCQLCILLEKLLWQPQWIGCECKSCLSNYLTEFSPSIIIIILIILVLRFIFWVKPPLLSTHVIFSPFFQVVAIGYGMFGAWFAFNALIPKEHAIIKDVSTTKSPIDEEPETEPHNNLIEILLICAITTLIGAAIRFLASLFLLRSIEKVRNTVNPLIEICVFLRFVCTLEQPTFCCSILIVILYKCHFQMSIVC